MKTFINFIPGRAIYSYHILSDCLELHCPGTIVTYTDSKEIQTIKQWIKEAKSFSKNKSEICTYLEYMIDYGQYETT